MALLSCSICKTNIYKNESKFKNCKTHYCSKKCQTQGQRRTIKKNCKECGSEIELSPSQVREFNFCSKSCVGKYSVYKCRLAKVGKRSKLEIYIENWLKFYFPYLTIECNHSLPEYRLELDFYFPDLNLGIEINGIYHYQPVKGGIDNFNRVQKNDLLKSELCLRLGINLQIVKTMESFKNKSTTANHLKTVIQILLSEIPYCVTNEMSRVGIEPTT
jgi:hypothetical protein